MIRVLKQKEVSLKNMIPIGKFSSACHVSIKTLRLYDALDLLKPAYVDQETSYRYYNSEQIDQMILIQRYKRYGFTLEEIKALMKHSLAENYPTLMNKQTELVRKIKELEMIVQDLNVMIDRSERNTMTENDSSYETYSIDIREEESLPIYGIRSKIGIGDFGIVFSKIFEHLAQEDLSAPFLTGARYFDEEFNAFSSDTELFVSVPKKTSNNQLPASLVAHTVHKGKYSLLNEAYAALVKWIEENGYEIVGAPYEIYTKCGMTWTEDGFKQIPIDQYVTDIYFPIQKKA